FDVVIASVGVGAMFKLRSRVPFLFAVVFLLWSCNSDSSSNPTAPSPLGQIRFLDSGCACGKPPYPGIPVYVDGQQAGLLPVFGALNVTVTPGTHFWSIDSPASPTPVHVDSGGTTKVHVVTNSGCPDDCTDSPTDPPS